MLRVRRSVQADNDLLEIWVYVADENPRAADRLVDLIEEKCALLAASPLIGTPCPALGHDLRYLAVGNYVLYYRADSVELTVVRILHGARDIESLFGESGAQ